MDNTFKAHPDLSEYFETSDGEKFYKEDLAKNHVRTFALKDAAIKTVLRPEETEEKLTAAEIIALVTEMDLDTATKHLDTENLLPKPRKSVVESLTARITELQN
ncbi:hypothetical protein SAMN05421847_2184 [Halpernia humi]|uniref:Uncharacterized protein n=1 Tax=Halpernia humi TaxID=493375 RepID=A0A1H5ZSG2_9FLAO|nr:hypothetical protein [Halpernia humi]SEG39369.1 hypothetical protein SAMN05421847_2184 [Halpernia humi]